MSKTPKMPIPLPVLPAARGSQGGGFGWALGGLCGLGLGIVLALGLSTILGDSYEDIRAERDLLRQQISRPPVTRPDDSKTESHASLNIDPNDWGHLQSLATYCAPGRPYHRFLHDLHSRGVWEPTRPWSIEGVNLHPFLELSLTVIGDGRIYIHSCIAASTEHVDSATLVFQPDTQDIVNAHANLVRVVEGVALAIGFSAKEVEDMACYPKFGPCGMRVFTPTKGKETFNAEEEAT